MKSVFFRMEASVKERFAKLCQERGLSMTSYLRLLVTDELRKMEGK